ncbi:MAG TPA: response regulator [Candidatus Polarisedimenticolaceae bacterium]|nr:response regulator [Candidatus Polarisedimenticolaceae bacterium]
MMRPLHAIQVLLVEDNPADVRLTRLALQGGKIEKHLNIAQDGESALAYLRQQGPYADSPRPDLILLDLNLPGKSGHEVLAEIKQDKSLRTIPTVVLTTSDREQDIKLSYELAANCYVTKPVGLNLFLQAIRRIEDFWIRTATLPRGTDAERVSGA